MRTDLPMPIFRINSEGDIAGGIGNGARAARLADVPQLGGRGRVAR